MSPAAIASAGTPKVESGYPEFVQDLAGSAVTKEAGRPLIYGGERAADNHSAAAAGSKDSNLHCSLIFVDQGDEILNIFVCGPRTLAL